MHFLLQSSPFSDLHELQKKQFTVYKQKNMYMYFMHLLTECVCLWSYIHFTLYLVHMINIFRVFCHITHMFYMLINIIISYKSYLRFIKNWILPQNHFPIFLLLFVDIGFVFISIQYLKLNRKRSVTWNGFKGIWCRHTTWYIIIPINIRDNIVENYISILKWPPVCMKT